MEPTAKTDIRKLSPDEYHKQTDYLSASMIKRFIESRRLFHDEYVLGSPRKRTASLDLGTVAHAMILEPHKIDEIAVEIPPEVLSKSGSKAGANWKKFEAENEGAILLKSSEMKTVNAIFANAYKNKAAHKLLKAKGETEESIFMEDHWGKIRCRVDRRIPGKFIIDLKTTRDAAPDKFERQVRELGYHIQAALYKRICDKHFGCDHTFLFIAVKSTHPYNVGIYSLSDRHLFEAENTLDRTIESITECKETGDWREPWEKNLIELHPPKWWEPNDEGESE